ncbi:hypothetical protein ACHAQJ_007208 [Trichoderma viride]
MSGAEVIGLISGFIALVDGSLQLYKAVRHISGLPGSFHDVANRLPIIQYTLEAALEWSAEGEENASSAKRRAALFMMVESCRNKAAALQKMLQSIIAGAGTSLIRRCVKAVKAISSADKVDSLMESIRDDLQVLMLNCTVSFALRF